MPRTITISVGLDTKQADTQLQGFERRFKSAIDSNAASISSLRTAVGGLAIGLTALGVAGVVALKQIAETALQAAINIDRQVNSLKALTGSAAAAERRFAALVAIARQTPGLTTELATTLDVQLRILNVTEQTINRLLPVIGRLNAISPLGDPRQFVNNLTQLITQGFERQDLKELVGQSPFAGQLLKEVFNVDNPTNAKAIREAAQRLGIRTVEDLSNALAKAAEANPVLQAMTESLGGQFEKLRDRLNLALAPFGKELAKTLLPLFDDLTKAAETFGKIAAQVFSENRQQIIDTTRALGNLGAEIAKILGSLASSPQFKEFIDLISVDAAKLADVSAGDARLIPQIFGQKGPRQIAAETRAAERRVPSVIGRPTVEGGLIATLKEMADFLAGDKKKSASGRDESADSAARDARALRDAQLAFTQSQAENELRIVRDINERGLRDLQDLFERGKITVREFHEFRQNLSLDTLDKELANIDKEVAALSKLLATAKGKDRIEAETKLNDTLTNQALKRKEILDTIEATGRKFKEDARLSAITGDPVSVTDPETEERARRVAELRRQASEFGLADLELRRQELQIQNAVAAGVLTEAEGRQAALAVQRQFRDVMLEALRAQEQLTADPERLAQVRLQIEQIQLLGVELSNAQRFARGFGSQIDSVGDAFERLGQNVSRALTNTRDLLGGLKQAVLGFFNDLLGQSLQNLFRSIFAPLAGIFGGGGAAGGTAGGGGIGGFFRQAFGGGGGGGGFQQLATAFAGGGGGLSAPPSVSLAGAATGIFANGAFARGLAGQGATGIFANGQFAAGLAGGSRFSLGGLLGGLAGAAPLLGLGLGAGLGGQSVAGNILGAIGGGAVGLGLSFGASVFSAAGGGLGALGPAALAALGPIALIGAPLLVGAFLLGKAKQRRRDEEAAGQFLGQAFQAVEQLATGIASDQIEGSQARAILESNIVGPFVQQINQLKTASVRRDWVKNQVPEIRGRFEANVVPLIADQERRRADAARFSAIDRRLIPQFAGGGIVSGVDRGFDSVRALLRPGEMVLTQAQQAGIARLAGADAFSRAGVPGVQPQAAFQHGGIVSATSQQGGDIVIEELVVALDAESIAVRGMSGENGRRVVINHVRMTQLNRG